MSFDTLLGNDRLKQNLTESLAKGHISHFYLISGPRGSGRHTLARLLAAAIFCRDARRPCLQCLPCRKLMEGNHPDFITVEDPEHKNVAVKIVRQFREDVFIRPNESDHKIYLFPQDLGTEGQNTLLKILEEPPAYGVYLLLTDNPNKLLPTIRSRATELKLQSLPEELLRRELKRRFPAASEEDVSAAVFRSGGYLGQALELLENGDSLPPQTESFLRAYGARDALAMAATLAPMEKWKRDPLAEILRSWLEIAEGALACRSGIASVSTPSRQLASARTAEELHRTTQVLRQALDDCLSNISPGAVCGWLLWNLI